MNKIVFAQMAARLEGGAGEQKKTGMLAFSRIMEAEEKVGVATISGYIGYGNATVDEFTKHLEELKAEGCTKFEVILNSMGGNLFEASGIYDIIKGCGMEVTAKIYGVAASAATLIACAAGRVLISENSRYMVHRARGCAVDHLDRRSFGPGIPGPGSIRALRTAPPLREKLHGQIITAPRNEKRPFTGRFFAYIRTFVSNRHKAASDRIGK